MATQAERPLYWGLRVLGDHWSVSHCDMAIVKASPLFCETVIARWRLFNTVRQHDASICRLHFLDNNIEAVESLTIPINELFGPDVGVVSLHGDNLLPKPATAIESVMMRIGRDGVSWSFYPRYTELTLETAELYYARLGLKGDA